MENIILSIQNPCHENWQNMLPTEQGRFCKSCQKEVIDFTQMSDAEMYKYLSALKENKFCCSALPGQLERPIFRPKEPPKPLSWYWNYIMVLLMLFAKSAIKAQTIKNEIVSMPIKTDTSYWVTCDNKVSLDDTITKSKIKPDSNVRLPKPDASVSGTIIIRMGGASSIRSSAEPLYVVDGVIERNGLSEINPQDIDCIEVLKEPAASAIYGNAAIEGVIIIKTKKKSIKDLPKRIIAAFSDSLNIYPNPVERGGEINIVSKSMQAGNYIMEVIGLSGAVALKQSISLFNKGFNNKLQCDNKWAAGIHFVKLINDKGELIKTGRFIVE